jgi:signal transduction histidine kinase
LLPLSAASVLSLLAVVEVVARSDSLATDLSTAVLLGLSSTAPLVLARSQLVVSAVAIGSATVLSFAVDDRPTMAGMVALLVVVYLLGRERIRQARAGAVERDASSQAVADALVENVARGERVRIAQELHDVVAHHISMVVVQAETTRLTTPGMPAEGADRLVAIGDTARAALTEMRRLLGVLREDAGVDTPREPQPGLRQLVELVDDARNASGGAVRLIVEGPIVPLEPGSELTVYRVVQEALTNARRHAPGAAVDVELTYASDAVRVRVRDSGPGAAAAGGASGEGHGLLGMRERVTMVGGTLRTGSHTGPQGRDAGGFVVDVRLPAPPRNGAPREAIGDVRDAPA